MPVDMIALAADLAAESAVTRAPGREPLRSR
jgi:hypothetical protein